jgi:hypothetical protein
MYSAKILFAGMYFLRSFVHLDGVRILFLFATLPWRNWFYLPQFLSS